MNPILALIFANIIWGAASPIFKFAPGYFPPFTLAFIRFFFAGILLLPFIGKIKWSELTPPEWLKLCLGSFFGITVGISFFFLGLQRAASINAPIISSSGPVFLYFLSIFFLKEKARIKVLLGMLIALGGVLFIILSPVLFDGQGFAFGELQGNIFYLMVMFTGLSLPVFFKKITPKMDFFKITGISFFIGSIGFIPFMLRELQNWSFSQLDIRGMIGILFGTILSSALAYLFYNFALSKLDAEETVIFTYIDPVISILIAVPLLGEYPSVYFFAGSVLVFSGIYLAEGRLHWHPFHRLHIPIPHVILPQPYSFEKIDRHGGKAN